ncbi:MAG: nucleotidyltransferase domain-containing protein [Janibacter sp.]
MTLLDEYSAARRAEDITRLRRVLALRAMVTTGKSQRQLAAELGITQPAVSQQLKFSPDLEAVHPEVLLEAAAPILKTLAKDHGYTRLAAFGSVARHEARDESDIDLIIESPAGTSSFDFIRFQQLLEHVLGRHVDLIDYGGLKPGLDDDIRRESLPL